MVSLQTYKNTSLATSISVGVLQLLKCDMPIHSFADNIHESCELHRMYNTSTTISVYDDLKKIGMIYILIHEDGLKNYLITNKELISILLEARVQIETRFGDVPLYLELHTDFDNPDWTKLFLIIKNNLPNNEAMEKLEDLFRNWFFQKNKITRKILTISEESL